MVARLNFYVLSVFKISQDQMSRFHYFSDDMREEFPAGGITEEEFTELCNEDSDGNNHPFLTPKKMFEIIDRDNSGMYLVGLERPTSFYPNSHPSQ
jgi:Ca2+-binding EF-hand superfamily protein